MHRYILVWRDILSLPRKWLKTFLQYSYIQKNYSKIKQIHISNKRYFDFALKVLNILNWGLQFLSKHYTGSAFHSVQVFGWCSAGAPLFRQCFVFRCFLLFHCFTGVLYSVATCSGVPGFIVYLYQQLSDIKNVLNYPFQIWKEDLLDMSFVTLR